VITAEFDKPAGTTPMVTAPVTPFPAAGEPEGAVLGGIRERLGENPFAVDKDFGNSYSGIPHPITRQLEELMRSTYFVEWAAEQQPGTLALEREAVRMVASLLGAPEGAGFITSGGTESNLAALRLARYHGGQAEPEVVAPVTMHFSFRLGAELMRIGLVEVAVDPHSFVPRIEAVEQAITPRTVGLVCSAPAGGFGTLEPVEAFADLAQRKGLWLHVDAAFGGFMLPFKRELGHRVEPFDFALPGVTSMMTDGHKLGLMPIATGFFIAREPALFDAIPTEATLIHTTSSTKPGSRAAAAWAVMKHLGRAGYRRSTAHLMDLVRMLADGIGRTADFRLLATPAVSVVAFTSPTIDLADVHRRMAEAGWGQGYGELRGMPFIRLSVHPSRDRDSAEGFLRALEKAASGARRR
jgi:tyrosine decarboxylase/aspartate 1-decarboxylase